MYCFKKVLFIVISSFIFVNEVSLLHTEPWDDQTMKVNGVQQCLGVLLYRLTDFFKKLLFLFSKDILININAVKTFSLLQKSRFQIKAVLNFLFIKESWKRCIMVSTEMFPVQQISILEWFLKDHMTLRTEYWLRKFSFATGIYCNLYIKIENSYFKL